MKTKAAAVRALALLLLSTLSATSGAVAIYLLPADQTVVVGEQFEVELWWDFSDDLTLGGGNDVFFDPDKLSFVSYTWNPSAGDDPQFRREPDELAGELNGIATGNFNCMPPVVRIGTIVFQATAPGATAITIQDTDSPAGPMVSCSTFNAQTVQYTGVTVTIPLDFDGDGVEDNEDNCTTVHNPDQCDTNNDWFGNVCDADLDNNNIVNSFDLNIMRASFGATGANDADINCNGIVNSFDLTALRAGFGQPPGPSGKN